MTDNEQSRQKKYQQAAQGFLILNLIYLGLFFLFLPPFDISFLKGAGYVLLFIVLFGGIAWGIFKESSTLVTLLIVIYTARIGFSVYSLISGQAFEAVPFVLPVLILTLYLLIRARWSLP